MRVEEFDGGHDHLQACHHAGHAAAHRHALRYVPVGNDPAAAAVVVVAAVVVAGAAKRTRQKRRGGHKKGKLKSHSHDERGTDMVSKVRMVR